MDSVRSPSFPTHISDDENSSSKADSTLRIVKWWVVATIRSFASRGGEDRFQAPLSPILKTPGVQKDHLKTDLNVLVPLNEACQPAVDYRSYRLIYKSQRHDVDVALEM